jgi:hypothetical protein
LFNDNTAIFQLYQSEIQDGCHPGHCLQKEKKKTSRLLEHKQCINNHVSDSCDPLGSNHLGYLINNKKIKTLQ